MKHFSKHSFAIVVAIITVVSSVQAKAVKAELTFPANFDVAAVLASAFTEVYAQSDTFRAQCDRLARAQNLCVSLRLDTNMRSSCRAFTNISRKQGVLRAEVHLPMSAELAELMGHELEHILEQLDHLNLRALAEVRGSGVRQVEFDLFETDRAQRTGKTVAREVREYREHPSAD